MNQVKKHFRWRHYEPYLWIMPTVLFLVIILAYAMLFSLYMSFTTDEASNQGTWIGFSNYLNLLRNDEFRTSLRNTLFFTGFAVALELILGLISALLLDRITIIRGFFRTAALLPMMLTPVVVGLMWKLLWDTDFGVINSISGIFGLAHVDWLGNPSTALFVVILADVWQNTPYVTMILLAALQGLPIEPYEAATIDGASPLQTIRYITLPLLKPAILICLIIRTLFAFRVFDTVYVLTSGGPANSTLLLSILIYRFGFRYFQFGLASGLSWIVVIICLVVTLIYLRMLRNDEKVAR